MTQVLQDTKAANEPSTSKPVSLLLLSQTASTENGTCLSKNDPEDTHIEGTKNPFYDIDPQESPSNPFMQANKEGRKAMPKRPLSEYSTLGPHIKITGDEFLASASCSDSSDNMKALVSQRALV